MNFFHRIIRFSIRNELVEDKLIDCSLYVLVLIKPGLLNIIAVKI